LQLQGLNVAPAFIFEGVTFKRAARQNFRDMLALASQNHSQRVKSSTQRRFKWRPGKIEGWSNARTVHARVWPVKGTPSAAKPSIVPSLPVAKVDDELRIPASVSQLRGSVGARILSLSEGTIGEISALLSRAALDVSEQITSASLVGADIRHHVNGGVSLQWSS
jgi:hypothetical protein